MIWLFLAAAILAAAHMSAPVQETKAPPPDEVRISEVANPDNIEDIDAEAGWYRKTKYGWIFSSDEELGPAQAPRAKFAAFMDGRTAESVGGVAVIVILGLSVIIFRLRKRRGGVALKDGVSQLEFQALVRRLGKMADILDSVTTDARGAKAVEKGGKKR